MPGFQAEIPERRISVVSNPTVSPERNKAMIALDLNPATGNKDKVKCMSACFSRKIASGHSRRFASRGVI
jgi:hypothetical protein